MISQDCARVTARRKSLSLLSVRRCGASMEAVTTRVVFSYVLDANQDRHGIHPDPRAPAGESGIRESGHPLDRAGGAQTRVPGRRSRILLAAPIPEDSSP